MRFRDYILGNFADVDEIAHHELIVAILTANYKSVFNEEPPAPYEQMIDDATVAERLGIMSEEELLAVADRAEQLIFHW